MQGLLHQLRDLWAERARVGLVVLGVVWGTLSLTLLFAFGQELVTSTTATTDNFGTGLLRVEGGSRTIPFRGLPAGSWVARVPEDVQLVLDAVPGVEAVAAEMVGSGSIPLEHGSRRINGRVMGATPAFGDLRNHRPQRGGRFLNERDEAEHRQVVFLGTRMAERLFGAEPAVGSVVEIWSRPFTVIGVLEGRITASSYNGDDRDKLLIPLSTFRGLFGRRTLSNIWVKLKQPGGGPDDRRPVIDALFGVLAARHGVHPDDRTAIRIRDLVEIEERIDLILEGNRVFLIVVGVIGLLVALVGVGNVTYVLVEERTREIGVQMALGARPRDVALARLFEGFAVTLSGGLLGIALTVGLLRLLNLVPLDPEVRAYLGYPSVSFQVAGVVVLLLVAGAGLAGWFPARRAAALDPVVALREE